MPQEVLLQAQEGIKDFAGTGLSILERANERSPYKVEVKHIEELTGKKGSQDEAVIEIVGKNKGVILTKDNDFRTLKHYYQLYKQHNTGVIFFHSTSKKFVFWDMVVSFINNWERIKEIAYTESPPFIYKFGQKGGVQRLEF